MNCCVWPASTEALPGVTAIDCSVGGVTVSTAVLLVIPSRAAVMLLLPAETAEASPEETLIVATAGLALVQLAVAVRSWVLLSL